MPLARPKARVRQAMDPGALEAHSWSQRRRHRREKECLVQQRFVSIRTADVSQHSCTVSTAWSPGSPPHLCSASPAPFSGSSQEVWPHQAVAATWGEVGWGCDNLSSKMGSTTKNTPQHSEMMLFVYCRCISTGRQLPARGAHGHKNYIFHCHKLFEPLLGFILRPGLGMEAARATTALGPAITVSGIEWLSQVPGILKIIYSYCYFI